MVRQSLREIDPKKVKMAKKVLAVFEVMGITEEELDALSDIDSFKNEVFEGLSKNLSAMSKRVESLESEVKELREFRESVLRTQKNEASGGTAVRKSLAEIIKDNYDGVEEFRPYGK